VLHRNGRLAKAGDPKNAAARRPGSQDRAALRPPETYSDKIAR